MIEESLRREAGEVDSIALSVAGRRVVEEEYGKTPESREGSARRQSGSK